MEGEWNDNGKRIDGERKDNEGEWKENGRGIGVEWK